MRFIVITLLLIALIMASGCLGEKTVIKANVTITEQNGTPVIESIDVTSAKVSKAESLEAFSIGFKNKGKNANMVIAWDTTRVTVPITFN